MVVIYDADIIFVSRVRTLSVALGFLPPDYNFTVTDLPLKRLLIFFPVEFTVSRSDDLCVVSFKINVVI